MKTLSIIFLASFFISNAQPAEEIDLGFVGFDNGIDHSPEGRRKTALNNAKWHLQAFMRSDEVPEGVRVTFAILLLKERMQFEVVFKKGERTDKNQIVYLVDQNGNFVIDEEKTKLLREPTVKEIKLLENRLVEIYNPHKEAEQAGTGQPATRSQSKSEGSEKPQPDAEGRSR